MKAKRTGTALVRSEVTVTNKASGKEVHRDARTKRVDLKERDHSGSVGVVKGGCGVTLSMGFQSVRVDIGAEVPWKCRPNHVEDLKPGLDATYELLDDELAARAKDLDGLLQTLARKYGRA